MTVPMLSARALGNFEDLLIPILSEDGFTQAFRTCRVPELSVERPEMFVPEKVVFRLLEEFARLSGDRNIALRFAKDIDLQNWGAWGRYALSSDTLRAAYQRINGISRYHVNLDKYSVIERGDEFLILHDVAGKHVVGYEHYALATACVLRNICREFLGTRWNPVRIELDIPRGKRAHILEEFFNCPVFFDRPQIVVAVERELGGTEGWRTTRANMITPSDLRRSVEPVPTDTIGIVREMIRLRLLDGNVDIDMVAADLNLGPRTLQRRLSDEGVVFRALVSQVRAERALELLRESDAPVAEIAAELGYSSTSHFSRAFQKTVGENPSDIRKRIEH